MRTRNFIAVALAGMVVATATPARAGDKTGLDVMADVLVARPACLVATVVGSTIFVVGLPFAAISKSVKSTAHVLVVRPAQATFQREIGDFDFLNGDEM